MKHTVLKKSAALLLTLLCLVAVLVFPAAAEETRVYDPSGMLTEAEAARAESGYEKDIPLHLDIPMTAEHIVSLLTEAGFAEVEVIHREGATALIRARKL